MARASLVVGVGAAASLLVGCFIVAGGTGGYTEAVVDAGSSLACQSAADCADAGPAVCCFTLQVSAGTVSSACTPGATCPKGPDYQFCAASDECADGGTCAQQTCSSLTFKTCGAPFCTQTK